MARTSPKALAYFHHLPVETPQKSQIALNNPSRAQPPTRFTRTPNDLPIRLYRFSSLPAPSRSQVSGVIPCLRNSAFWVRWVAVLGS